jgi:hypothetical protein
MVGSNEIFAKLRRGGAIIYNLESAALGRSVKDLNAINVNL